MIIIAIIIILVVLVAIRVTAFNAKLLSFNTYLIDKGQHYSYIEDSPFKIKYKVSPTLKHKLRFEVLFGIGCMYDDFSLGQDRFDINKLYGLQYALDGSCRVGWRWSSEKHKIELFIYTHHHNKPVTIDGIGSLSIGDKGTFVIDIDKKKRTVYCQLTRKSRSSVVGDETLRTKIILSQDQPIWRIKFRLWPYFGGNRTAPQPMKIFIKEL